MHFLKNSEIEVITLFGFHDLFELKLHWNDRLVSHAVFLERARSKRFLERWGQLQRID